MRGAVAQQKLRNPQAEQRDTKRCPVCKAWIDSPTDRLQLDEHIYKEHPEEFNRQEEMFKQRYNTTGGTGRLPHVPREPDEEELLRKEYQKTMAREKAAKEPKEEKAPREPRVITLKPCLDGCGEMVKSNFKPGHDAKLKSAIVTLLKEDPERNLVDEPSIIAEAKEALPTLFKGRFAPNIR